MTQIVVSLVLLLATAVGVWRMVVRAIRVSALPRPLSDVAAFPILIAFASVLAAGFAAALGAFELGADAWPFLLAPLALAPLGALWGGVYWLLAGRPRPPYA